MTSLNVSSHRAAPQRPSPAALPAARTPGAGALRPWSIDDEPMGPGWHDSSRMLRTGLQVIEGAPLDALPAEWRLAWRC